MIRNKDVKIIIPFRLRETGDIRRQANLDLVQAWWFAHGFDPIIVSDGLSGDEQFNRHRAYNRGVSGNPANVYVFAEADMLVPPDQVRHAIELAIHKPGIVVPFTQYLYWSDDATAELRDFYHDSTTETLATHFSAPVTAPDSIFNAPAEYTIDNGRSIGAVNVITQETLDITGGFTEATSGNWYDDNIIEQGFAFLTRQKTRFVPGPAVHAYHLQGTKGSHVTEADRRATEFNKRVLIEMQRDIRMRREAKVRSLMGVRINREGVK